MATSMISRASSRSGPSSPSWRKTETITNYEPLQENLARLREMKVKRGAARDSSRCQCRQESIRDGLRLPASYANFYIANECVLLPTFADRNDAKAISILERLFPRRRVVPDRLPRINLGTRRVPLPHAAAAGSRKSVGERSGFVTAFQNRVVQVGGIRFTCVKGDDHALAARIDLHILNPGDFGKPFPQFAHTLVAIFSFRGDDDFLKHFNVGVSRTERTGGIGIVRSCWVHGFLTIVTDAGPAPGVSPSGLPPSRQRFNCMPAVFQQPAVNSNPLFLWQITESTASAASVAMFYAPCRSRMSNASARSTISPIRTRSRIF